MKTQNTPYVKNYENGILKNPITKDNPYLVSSGVDKKKLRKSTNKGGFGLIIQRIGIMSFVKYKMVKQFTGNRTKRMGLITHLIAN